MQIRDAEDADLSGIMEIYNDAVANTTAIWNDSLVDLENRRAWRQARLDLGYPVLAAIEDGKVLGFASFGDWRAFDGYRHTVEHSVYVHKDARGRGLAQALMKVLIERAKGCGKHVMVAGVESGNAVSIKLHHKLGFKTVGFMPQVGCKFGRWLDLTFLQLRLDDRPTPDAG